ncbi:MAG: type II secretion system F family protein [Clostridium sp.]|jgi:Flp pilus assembly protein TadB|nr:type II secretion system F family protein [Clostridium sp.]
MEGTIVSILRTAIRGFATLLVFGLLVQVALDGVPKRLVLSAYAGVLTNLKNRPRFAFQHEAIQKYLNKNGASFHFGRWMKPVPYLALRCILLICGVLTGTTLGFWFGLFCGILLYELLPILIYFCNRADNEKLLPELKLVYQALAMQIKAGVYVTDALSECYGSVKHKRLRAALLDLSADFVMKGDFGGALEKLQDRFDNRYIDALCITLFQAQESGQAVELLSDIAEQIKDMEATQMSRKKASLDRSVTFYQLGIFAVVMAVVLYACVRNIFQATSLFRQ